MRIVIVQYEGDYGASYRRLKQGLPETFRDQKHTVFHIEALAKAHTVTVVAGCSRKHDEVLTPELRSIGLGVDLQNQRAIWRLMDSLKPQLLILSTPSLQVLRWAAVRRPIVLPSFADYFSQTNFRQWFRNLRLAVHLALVRYPCVANHSLNASLSVRNLMVPHSKIVPREHHHLKAATHTKSSIHESDVIQLYYAGAITAAKGCVDIIEAVTLALRQGHKVHLKLSGGGEIEPLIQLVKERGLSEAVQFLGLTPNYEVLKHMRAADIVVVPTRHEYPEGLPNTIYEALASRTPLIISDHPAFAGRLIPEQEVLIAPAGNPSRWLEQILRLRYNSQLYTNLSQNSAKALQKLYVGPELTEVINRFIQDPINATEWVAPISLKAWKSAIASIS